MNTSLPSVQAFHFLLAFLWHFISPLLTLILFWCLLPIFALRWRFPLNFCTRQCFTNSLRGGIVRLTTLLISPLKVLNVVQFVGDWGTHDSAFFLPLLDVLQALEL